MVVLTIIIIISYCFEIPTIVSDDDINLDDDDEFRKHYAIVLVNGNVNDNSGFDIVFDEIDINNAISDNTCEVRFDSNFLWEC